MKASETSGKYAPKLGIAMLALVLISGCATHVRKSEPGEAPGVALEKAREEVRMSARDTLDQLYAAKPEARSAVEGAAGYAVFSNFGTKILVTGGGSGKGIAVNNMTQQEVFMRMAEFQAGLGFGVKLFRQVWVFENQDAFARFVDSGMQFGGQATLAATSNGAGLDRAGAVSISPGVWLYQFTDKGLALELTIKGTKYYRDKGLD